MEGRIHETASHDSRPVELLASAWSGVRTWSLRFGEGYPMHVDRSVANGEMSPLPGGGSRSLRLAMEIRHDGPKRWAWSLSVLAACVGLALAWAGMVRFSMDMWVGTHPWFAYSVAPIAMLAGVFGICMVTVSFLRVGPPPFSR